MGIVIAAELDNKDGGSTTSVIVVLIVILNIFVIVLFPLQLIMRVPALLKVREHAQKCVPKHLCPVHK